VSLPTKIRKNAATALARALGAVLDGLRTSEVEHLASHVAKSERGRIDGGLYAFAKDLATKIANPPNRFTENGEQALLDRLAGEDVRVVFDVGANKGVWSSHAASVFPHAALHAFEIVPQTFEKLAAALEGREGVVLNKAGLDAADGEVMVNVAENDVLSSVFDMSFAGAAPKEVLALPVRSGASYAAERGIEEIDVLKIDVEGAERRVLEGFRPLFEHGAVRLVQFEYNRGSILGEFLLKSAYDLFGGWGYRLGRLMPDGVLFHDYHYTHEDFVGPNYVAIRESDDAWRRLIERPA